MSRALVAPAALALALASPAVAWAAPDDDPRGNNGTIKVDGVPLDGGKGNEPHVDCAFALDFYGFDKGDVADIVFTGKPPTGPDRVLLSQSDVAISDDAAGGGQDADATLSYTAAQLGLTGEAPHRNGWHVKVTADVESAPGGAKSKVFWIDCASPTTTQAGTTSSGATTTSGGGTTTGSSTGSSAGTASSGSVAVAGTTTSTTSSTTSGTSAAAQGSGVAGAYGEAAAVGAARDSAAGESAVAGAYGEAAVSANDTAAPSSLAATGGELAALVALGLTALGIGTASVVAGRRSRSSVA